MNHQPEISKSALVISSLIVFFIILFCGLMTVVVITDPAVKYAQVLVRAAMTIRTAYPDSLDWERVMVSARQAMMNELDPFSGYVRKEQLIQFEEDLSGGYFGIGISVFPHELGLLILDVREGSPAATAGVLTGDIVIASDSITLKGLTPSEAVRQIKGEENTILQAKVYRPVTQDTLQFEIVRKRIEFLHIPFAGFTSDSALYIRLLDFSAGAAEDLKKALDSLYNKDDKGIKGIILDLRGNPGGLLIEANTIVEMFLDKGEFIVGTSSRSRWQEDSFVSNAENNLSGIPLAIIVDNGSASASEIVAGALKFSGQAVLVGDTTFGKGLVQGIIRLPDGDALRLTMSRYYFEGEKYINAVDSFDGKHAAGLAPDILYSFVEEEPFYLHLERSQLLWQFAHKFQDEIISSAQRETEKQKWLQRMRQYALENGFVYESEATKSAKALAQAVGAPWREVESVPLKKLAGRAVATAASLDLKLFEKYGDFIWMRLRQIAYERKYGTYLAYKEAVVPYYAPIVLAASVLIQKDTL